MLKKAAKILLNSSESIIIAIIAGIIVYHYGKYDEKKDVYYNSKETNNNANNLPNERFNMNKNEHEDGELAPSYFYEKDRLENTENTENVVVFHNKSIAVCEKTEITINVFPTLDGATKRAFLRSDLLNNNAVEIKLDQKVKLSNDCEIRLLELGQELFKPGRVSRKFAKIQVISKT